MSYPKSYKAQAIAAELMDRLKIRSSVASLAMVLSSDTDAFPLITVGTLTTGGDGFIIKVESADWPLAEDVLGNSAQAFTPHAIHVLWEAAAGGGLDSGEKLDILAQVAEMGCEVKLYESASGQGVVLADIDDDDKLVGSHSPDAWRPLISQQ